MCSEPGHEKRRCWRVSIFSAGGGSEEGVGGHCSDRTFKRGVGTEIPSSQKSHVIGICLEWRRAAVGSVLHWTRSNTSFSLGGMKEDRRNVNVFFQSMSWSMLFHFSW